MVYENISEVFYDEHNYLRKKTIVLEAKNLGGNVLFLRLKGIYLHLWEIHPKKIIHIEIYVAFTYLKFCFLPSMHSFR